MITIEYINNFKVADSRDQIVDATRDLLYHTREMLHARKDLRGTDLHALGAGLRYFTKKNADLYDCFIGFKGIRALANHNDRDFGSGTSDEIALFDFITSSEFSNGMKLYVDKCIWADCEDDEVYDIDVVRIKLDNIRESISSYVEECNRHKVFEYLYCLRYVVRNYGVREEGYSTLFDSILTAAINGFRDEVVRMYNEVSNLDTVKKLTWQYVDIKKDIECALNDRVLLLLCD